MQKTIGHEKEQEKYDYFFHNWSLLDFKKLIDRNGASKDHDDYFCR